MDLRKWGKRFGMVMSFALVICSFCIVPASAATLIGTEQRVTTAAGDQWDPHISGNKVIYTDLRNVDTDVYYTDLSSGSPMEYPVSIEQGYQQLTDVSDGKIVYTDFNTTDIILYDTKTGQTTNLTNEAKSNSVDPAISGNLVTWKDDRTGNAEIFAEDLSTGEVRQISNSPNVDEAPSISGNIIVWQEDTTDEGVLDVFSYNWDTKLTLQLMNTPYGDERYADVNGNTVVYQCNRDGQYDIYAYDLATGTETRLSLLGDQVNPHISGDFVSYDDQAGGNYHIGLWQLSSGRHFEVTQGTSGQYLNDIDGDHIVYTDDRNGGLDIYEYTFSISEDKQQYELKFDGNGFAGGTVPEAVISEEGNTVSLPDEGDLFRSGCEFLGWNTEKDGSGIHYAADSDYTICDEDVILYAEWKDVQPPVIHAPADVMVLATGSNHTTLTWADIGTATATDNVDTNVAITNDAPTGLQFLLGTTAITYTATDNTGNTSSAIQNVTVNYSTPVFYQPVDLNGIFNKAKAGSSIPVKFSLGGSMGINVFEASYPVSAQIYPDTKEIIIDTIETVLTAGESGLRYDTASEQYTYIWKTDKDWGNTYRQLLIKFTDGQSITVFFYFVK